MEQFPFVASAAACVNTMTANSAWFPFAHMTLRQSRDALRRLCERGGKLPHTSQTTDGKILSLGLEAAHCCVW